MLAERPSDRIVGGHIGGKPSRATVVMERRLAAVRRLRARIGRRRPALFFERRAAGHGEGLVEEVSNRRTVFSSAWQREGEEWVYTVRGNGFLHHMVRNLVGTFLVVGKGTLRPEDVTRILEAKNRSAAGPTAPAHGLYLVSVEY